VSEIRALKPHTWNEITGRGFAFTHDSDGEFLYGIEVFVDPEVRGLGIGQRFYRERRGLCQYLRLRGIVIAGRIPGYRRRKKKVDNPEEYVELAKKKSVRDPVLSFQLYNAFKVLGVLKDYLGCRQGGSRLCSSSSLKESSGVCDSFRECSESSGGGKYGHSVRSKLYSYAM
jgi:GNAT superfamily N-acetyltransferase